MKRKIAEHIMVSLGIGFIVTTACLWCFGAWEETGIVVMRHFTTWLAASILYGITSLIYDTPLPFPFSAAIHFILCGAITFAASAVSGLLEIMDIGGWFIHVLPAFVIIYIIISIAIAVDTHFKAKKINEKIKEKQK